MKRDIGHGEWLRADVEHFHLAEDREIADESIEAGTYIDVSLRGLRMNPAGHQLILEKVSPQRTRSFIPFGQDG